MKNQSWLFGGISHPTKKSPSPKNRQILKILNPRDKNSQVSKNTRSPKKNLQILKNPKSLSLGIFGDTEPPGFFDLVRNEKFPFLDPRKIPSQSHP